MAGAADAQVYIEAVLKDSVTGALNDLESNAKKAGENAEGHISQRVGAGVKLLGGLAIAAAGSLITMLGDGVAGAMEAEKAMAQLDAVITSTGNAAGVSKDHLKALADQMQLNTQFTAEQVTATQSMLLTFTNIGASGGIFDQATQAALDMAAALGGEASDKAIMLGKALNDPAAGITALTRVGVTFSDSQKEVIKSMAETGNVAGAQKLILAELSKEFGGSATAAGKTMAGQLAIAKNAFGEVTEEIGVKLLPVLTKILQWVVANMPAIQSGVTKAMDFVSKVFQAVKKDVDTVVAAFNLIVNAVKAVASGISAGTKAVKTATENLWATVKGVFINVTKFFTDIGKAIIDGIVAGIKAAPKAVADALGGVVNGAVQGVKDLLGIKSPSKVFKEIGDFTVEGFATGLGKIGSVLEAIEDPIAQGLGRLTNAVSGVMQSIAKGDVLGAITGAVTFLIGEFQRATKEAEEFRKATEAIDKSLRFASIDSVSRVRTERGGFLGFGTKQVREVDEAAMRAAQSMENAIVNGITSGFKAAIKKGDFAAFGETLRANIGEAVLDGLIDAFITSAILEKTLGPAIDKYVQAAVTPDTADDVEAANGLMTAADQAVALGEKFARDVIDPVARRFNLYGADRAGVGGGSGGSSSLSLPGIGIQSAVATPIVESARILKDVAGTFQAQVAAFGGHVGNFGGFVAEVRALAADLRANAANGTAGLRYA